MVCKTAYDIAVRTETLRIFLNVVTLVLVTVNELEFDVSYAYIVAI